MKSLRILFFLLCCIIVSQCTKEDQLQVNTEINNLPDRTEVTFLIQIIDDSNNPISGAKLTDQRNNQVFTSDQNGLITLRNYTIPALGLPISVEADGWMKQIKVLRGKSNSQVSLQIELFKFDTESFIQTGNTGAISKGGRLTLPPTLVQDDNTPYSGPVKVKSHYYDPTDDDFLRDAPGDMTAIGNNNQILTLQSYGMYAIELFDDAGNELNIPDEQTATIEFPIPSNYGSMLDEIPLWSMNESTGKWEEEGIAIRQNNFFVAQVTHFSWWNCDISFEPVEICMTLVDQQGNPLSGVTYLITSPDQEINYFTGVTDANGNLCAQIPIDLPVSISVWFEDDLTIPIDLGTFTTFTELGNVIIDDISFISVNGKAVDCNGTPISDAVVSYNLDGNTKFAVTQEDGTFQLVLRYEGTLEIKIIDQINLIQSSVVSLPISGDQSPYNIPDIVTCEEISDGQPIIINSNITTDATWTPDNIYILAGRISVENGATLTIEPGTIIKGQAGSGVNSTSLFISRGSKIMAEGTPESPIIFTSVLDEISPADIATGNFASPNLDPDVGGFWGGVAILGYAPISLSDELGNEISEVLVEGIPATNVNLLYGGDDPSDNSGVFRYVSIRHAGANIGAGNNLNGLTLGAVGSGTTIDQVEIVGGADDGIEIFGGNVDITNLVVWHAGDDGIDTDQAWGGTLNNFAVILPNRSCFELDGPEGSFEQRHTIQNGSVIATIDVQMILGRLLIDVDENTLVDLKNIHFVAPLENLTITEDEVDNTTFENVTFDIDPALLPNLMEQDGPVPPGISAGGAPQANVTVFEWTWTSQAGLLDNL